MNKIAVVILLFLMPFAVCALPQTGGSAQDTNAVINLSIKGFDLRLTDATQTVKYADEALAMAEKLHYTNGIALAYRIKGLGEYYLGNSGKAIENYLSALTYFHRAKNFSGEVNIYNNIGTLYLDIDFDKCLEYLNNALDLYKSKQLKDKNLLASIYLNLGNANQRKLNFSKALNSYNESYKLVSQIDNPGFRATVLQNMGVAYSSVGNYDKAKELLFSAIKQAKELDLNQPIAQINLTLAEIYTSRSEYKNAEKCLDEGKAYATLLKSERLMKDYETSYYQLELKRKNFELALRHLQNIQKQDSVMYQNNSSAALSLYQVKYKQDELKRENERIILRQNYNRNIVWGTFLLTGLLVVVIALLVNNVKRKAETNKKLTSLNTEISEQKDNLDRINHHLEEIINERTLDLQIKNRKLSDYSSYLSHQIRGPIATLKGLMNLEKEGLVNQAECIKMMTKCVTDIDDKIVDMSDMLHNPQRAGM
jgi:tetratricopeptide (TPR) repeat protein